METLKKNKILLGLSGGVDSTAAVLLLKEKGFEVVGYYFDVLGNNEEGVKRAQEVADQLGIEFIAEDVKNEFDRKVISNFCSEYSKGRTPNPCVVCNPNVKFKKLVENANKVGAYYIATGHYARVIQDEQTRVFHVAKGVNERKDQSYMLYRLGQDVLSRLILPLGEFDDKEKTRGIVRNQGIDNADAKDSQEICFVDDDTNYEAFLEERGYKSAPGKFVDKDGKVLGDHKGISSYTIGQRKGLGIALGKPAFVTEINSEKNTVTLGDNADLFKVRVISTDNVITDKNLDLTKPVNVQGKIRYAAKPANCTIIMIGKDLLEAIFEEPQRAATPGQSVVFYDGDLVVGGGFISEFNGESDK